MNDLELKEKLKAIYKEMGFVDSSSYYDEYRELLPYKETCEEFKIENKDKKCILIRSYLEQMEKCHNLSYNLLKKVQVCLNSNFSANTQKQFCEAVVREYELKDLSISSCFAVSFLFSSDIQDLGMNTGIDRIIEGINVAGIPISINKDQNLKKRVEALKEKAKKFISTAEDSHQKYNPFYEECSKGHKVNYPEEKCNDLILFLKKMENTESIAKEIIAKAELCLASRTTDHHNKDCTDALNLSLSFEGSLDEYNIFSKIIDNSVEIYL